MNIQNVTSHDWNADWKYLLNTQQIGEPNIYSLDYKSYRIDVVCNVQSHLAAIIRDADGKTFLLLTDFVWSELGGPMYTDEVLNLAKKYIDRESK